MKMKNCFKTLVAAFISLTGAVSLNAEVFESSYTTTVYKDPLQITDMIIGPGVTVHPTGWKLTDTLNSQIGLCSNLIAQSASTFTNGIILSTGSIEYGNSLTNLSSAEELPDEVAHPFVPGEPRITDLDLDTYFSGKFYDPAGFVLYIQPKNKTINIPFIMASEEFYYGTTSTNDYVCEDYADGFDRFAFFFQEVKTDASGNVVDEKLLMTNNIALLPDGGDVNIETVNPCTNLEYFCSNVGDIDEEGNFVLPNGDINLPMEFNGAITGLVAIAEDLDTNKIYKLKIVIGDASGNTINSVLFLKARGITSGADLKIDVTGPAFINEPGNVVFTNTVSNIGPATADGVVVTNYLPVGAENVTCKTHSAGEVDVQDGYIVWKVGDRFAPGSNAVMTVSCELKTSGVHTNIAHVVTSTGDYDESNNTGMCKTVVGSVKLPLKIRAIVTNKVYGAEMSLGNLAFVASIADETNGTYTATGIDVAFTNLETQAAADPKSASATVGRYGIYLSNVDGINTNEFAGITYVPGELEITKALLTISVSNAEWRVETDRPTYRIEDFSSQLKPGDTQEDIIDSGEIAFTNAFWTGSKKPTDYDAKTYTNEIWLTRECLVGDKAGNYSISIDPGDLTILKQLPKLTIWAIETNKVEGTVQELSDLQFIASIDGTNGMQVVTGINVTFTNAQGDAAWPTNANAEVGEYGIFLSDVQGINPDEFREIEYKPGKFTVLEGRDLHVYAIDTNKVYGTELSIATLGFIARIDGTNATETVTGIDVSFTNAAGEVAYPTNGTAEAGTYGIVISNIQGFATSAFTSVTYHPGTLTVAKRPLTITARNRQKQYGRSLTFAGIMSEVKITSGSLIDGDSITFVKLQCEEGVKETAAYRSQGYPIEITDVQITDVQGDRLKNYQITTQPGTLMITRYPIVITANDVTNVYGTASTFSGTEFTVDPVKLPNGDHVDWVTLTNLMPVATDVGTYTNAVKPSHVVTGAQFNANNYAIAFSNGTLTVIRRDITILAKNAEKVYGDELSILGVPNDFIVTNGTLAAGEQVTSVHIDCDLAVRTDTSVGPHPEAIKPWHPVTGIGGFETNNYNIAFSNGTLTVTKREITVTPVDTNKVYGAELTFTGLPNEFTVSTNLWNSDKIERVTLESSGTNLTAKAGDHDILAKDARGPGVENYAISYGTGTLHVAQFKIEIKANDTNKVYGTGFELKGLTNEFTVTSGEPGKLELPNGEQVTNVTMLCELSADEDPKASFGTYLITPTNAVSGSNDFEANNYEITFTSGTLTVKKMPITVIANDVTNCYGDAVVFTGREFSVAPPLPNEEKVETVTLTNLMPITTSVGTYTNAIKPWHAVTGSNGFATNNYEIAFSNGTLTVTQALLTVSVSNVTYRVGKPWNPPLAPSYGFSLQPKAGDTIEGVMGENVTYSNKVFNAKPEMEDISPEPYEDEIWIKPESITGERAANYVIRIDPGDLTVIHADPEFKTAITWKLNWTDGLLYADSITIENVGDGEAEAGYDYWVELPAGPATNGTRTAANPEHAFYLVSKDGTIPPEGNDYKVLTEQVTNALMAAYGRVEFFPTEKVTLTGVGISVYSWDLTHPDKWYAGADEFFAKNFFMGKLFSPADTDKNFKVSAAEKAAAAPLLGESISDYLEMTRLELLKYYHWNREKGTWTGPAKAGKGE